MDDMENGSTVDLPADDTLVLTLKRPVTLGPVSYETLTFREPTAGEVRKALAGAENNIAQTMQMAQLVAAVPMKVIEQIAASDLVRLDRFFGRFLTPPPDTPA